MMAQRLVAEQQLAEAVDIYDRAISLFPAATEALLVHLHSVYEAIGGNRYELYVSRYFDFEIGPTEKVLDIGSGHDPFPFATHLADRALDDNQYGRAGAAFKQVGALPVSECDIEDMSCFADKQFDFIHCSHVLEHVVDPARACRELMRVASAATSRRPAPPKICFSTRRRPATTAGAFPFEAERSGFEPTAPRTSPVWAATS